MGSRYGSDFFKAGSSLLMWALIIQFNNADVSNKVSETMPSFSLPLSLDNFLVTNFQKCNCFILHDVSRHEFSNGFHAIISSAMHNSEGGVFLAHVKNQNNISSSPFLASFTKLVDVGKVHPQCTFGIIHISKMTTVNELPTLFKFLQDSHGMIKTDADRFLLMSSNEAILNEMLTSKSFGTRFKFAVGLHENLELAKIANFNINLKSYCYFCKDGQQLSYTLNDSSEISTKLFVDRTMNLEGAMLRISTPTSTRWLNEMQTIKNEWVPLRGIYSIALDQLMGKYNFTAQFFPSTGGGTGTKVNKTHWIGTVGDVFHGRADIGHVTASTLQRLLIVDASFPISYEWLTFTTGKAAEYHTWKTVYWPFTPLIWQLTAITSLVGVILFKMELKATSQRSSLGRIIQYMLGVIMEQGVKDPEQMPTLSIRITIVMWLIFGLIMGTAYRSKLTAFLAFPHIEQLPQSFEELSQSHYQIGLQYIKGAAYQILKTSTHPTYATIFKRMELEESDVTCFKRALNSDFACISWDSIADYVYHKNLTDKYGHVPLTKAPDSTCFLTAGLVMSKRSILKAGIDHFLVWAMDTGMMDKWRQLDHDYVATQRKRWEKETNQPEKDYTPPKNTALTFSHLSGGYYVFCVGIIISLLGFAGEKIHGQYKENRDTKGNRGVEVEKM